MNEEYTAAEWMDILYPNHEIIEYDGWDAEDLDYEFNHVPITSDTFKERISKSTIKLKD